LTPADLHPPGFYFGRCNYTKQGSQEIFSNQNIKEFLSIKT
jgi:hypothetical protein